MSLSDLGALLNFLIVMAFVFLVLSLVASILVEVVAGLRGSRGKMLRRRLMEMFDDPEGAGFAGLLISSPLMRSLSGRGQLPSYIPPDVFAQSVMAIIREHNLVHPRDLPPVLRHLAFAEGFGTEAERAAFGDKLIAWYDRAMERLTGKYRRRSKATLFVVGLVIAVGLNVDTLDMTRQIWANRLALDESVSAIASLHKEIEAAAEKQGVGAEELLGADGDPAKTDADLQRKVLELTAKGELGKTVSIPLGWALRDEDCPEDGEAAAPAADGETAPVCTPGQQLAELGRTLVTPTDWSMMKIIGWLLTALAILPGAKFWFEIIGAAISLRAAGPKPPARKTKPEADGSPAEAAGAGAGRGGAAAGGS